MRRGSGEQHARRETARDGTGVRRLRVVVCRRGWGETHAIQQQQQPPGRADELTRAPPLRQPVVNRPVSSQSGENSCERCDAFFVRYPVIENNTLEASAAKNRGRAGCRDGSSPGMRGGARDARGDGLSAYEPSHKHPRGVPAIPNVPEKPSGNHSTGATLARTRRCSTALRRAGSAPHQPPARLTLPLRARATTSTPPRFERRPLRLTLAGVSPGASRRLRTSRRFRPRRSPPPSPASPLGSAYAR